MYVYDLEKIKSQITDEDIYNLLTEWGGEPEYTNFGFISTTICHNPPETVGSRKLYYYSNSHLFQCYTDCGESFDIFELAIKIAKLRGQVNFGLSEAIRLVAQKCNIVGENNIDFDNKIEDWQIFNNYDRIQEIELKDYKVPLPVYDSSILERLNYNVRIEPWLREGITEEVMRRAKIGYFPGGEQISIPHFNKDGEFIGLRGRSLCKQDSEDFGKYRPIYVNRKWYSHPLGMNLYNLNNSKDNIKRLGKAIVFESEKSCLQYASYFGFDLDISVACCGSNFSIQQFQLLLEAGAKEVIFAFDRQFQEIGDDEFKRLTKKLLKLNSKYKQEALISFIFDKNMITSYKASPTDEGKEKFLQLYNERIIL